MRKQRRLDVARVLRGLDQQDVRAALDQALRLCVKVVDKLWKRDAAVTVIAFVVGPIEPATNRGFPESKIRRPPAARVSPAVKFSSYASCSIRTRPAPAASRRKYWSRPCPRPPRKYARWMSSTTSGRVRTRFSLQPSSAGPPKSAAVRFRCCSMVPIAPSRTSTRSARICSSAC